MKRAARRDVNEAEIVQALEDIGVTVCRINQEGLPDVLTCYRDRWLPIEIKAPGGSLTPLQAQLRKVAWFPVISSVAEALALFGVHDTQVRGFSVL